MHDEKIACKLNRECAKIDMYEKNVTKSYVKLTLFMPSATRRRVA